MSVLSRKIYDSFIFEDRYLFFVDGLKTTILLAVFAFLLATVLGALFCAMIRSKNKIANCISKVIIWFSVQIPAAVMLMIMVYIIFQGLPLALEVIAIVALGIKMSGYIADVFRTAIDGVAPGETEAARSLGMTKRQAFIHVTLPQTVKNAMPLYKNEFILTLQETSIVGYVAIQDLTKASNIVTGRTFDAIFGLIVISILYVVIGAIISRLLDLLYREKHMEESELEALLADLSGTTKEGENQ